jgi:hypothetical protein
MSDKKLNFFINADNLETRDSDLELEATLEADLKASESFLN